MAASFIICTAICGILVFRIIKWVIRWREYHRHYDQIPGPPGYPIIGNVLTVLKVRRADRWKWFMDYSKQFDGKIFRTWIGEIPNIHLTRAQHLETVVPSSSLIKKSFAYDFINVWLGTGLLTATGEKWHQHRKLITPTFHFNILEDFSIVMSEKSDVLNRCIEAKIEKNPDEPLDVFVMLTSTALDIICEAAMGINCDFQSNCETEYTIALHSLSKLTIDRVFRPWLFWDWIYYRTARGKHFRSVVDLAHNFTHRVIQERKQARKNQQEIHAEISDKPKRKAFLDHLLDACERDGMTLTDDELRSEVDTFSFAGHDTTGAAMSYVLFCIGSNPEIQEKLHEELMEVFGDSTASASLRQLSELKYLDRVIKETLRLFPSAPSVSRAVTEDVVINGYKLLPGSMVSIHIHQVQRDPEYWPNPEKFDPDRFLPENSQGRHPYAYIPFSAGPRNCIGQRFAQLEIKTVLTAVLRKWRVKSQLKFEELNCYTEIILRPVDGVNIYFTRK